jgi:hypothetical protein
MRLYRQPSFFKSVVRFSRKTSSPSSLLSQREPETGVVGAQPLPVEQIRHLGIILKDGATTAADGSYRLYVTVIINQTGPFFYSIRQGGELNGFGTYRAGSNGGRVLAILHELAHLILKDGQPLIVDDGASPAQSATNTTIIENACGQEIKTLIRNWNSN